MLRFVLVIFTSVAACAASLDASYFGFSTSSTNNIEACIELELYANTNENLTVNFSAGTYIVNLPVSGDPLYRGLQQGACQLTNVSGLTVSAASAVFYCTNMNSSSQAIFRLHGCTNVTINAQFLGAHTGAESGIRGIWCYAGNSNCTFNVRSTQMRDAVRIGEFEDPDTSGAWFEGNEQITVTATNYDSTYGVVCYLAKNLTITNYSEGTSANDWGASRGVYISGATNVVAYAWCKNMRVGDGCHLITSAPGANDPYHFGCSNVTLTVTDLGTTNFVLSQSVVKIGTVSSSVSSTNTIHDGITITVDAPSSETVRTNNYAIAIGSVGTNSAHVYTNITLSGHNHRGPSNIQTAIYLESNAEGLSNVTVRLDGFVDDAAPARYTFIVSPTEPIVDITAVDTVFNLISLANEDIQTFTNLGNRPLAPVDLGAVGGASVTVSWTAATNEMPIAFNLYSSTDPNAATPWGSVTNGIASTETNVTVTRSAGTTYYYLTAQNSTNALEGLPSEHIGAPWRGANVTGTLRAGTVRGP